jgi:hypothetical protein
VLCHDSLNHWQTETRALANSLGGKERLEEMLFHIIAHPATGIGHTQAHELTGPATTWQTSDIGVGHLNGRSGER